MVNLDWLGNMKVQVCQLAMYDAPWAKWVHSHTQNDNIAYCLCDFWYMSLQMVPYKLFLLFAGLPKINIFVINYGQPQLFIILTVCPSVFICKYKNTTRWVNQMSDELTNVGLPKFFVNSNKLNKYPHGKCFITMSMFLTHSIFDPGGHQLLSCL